MLKLPRYIPYLLIYSGFGLLAEVAGLAWLDLT